jgi:vacuolar-type H+-ATPase subunit H
MQIGVLEVTDGILAEILETEAEAAEIERRAWQEAKDRVQGARLHARQLIEKGVAEDERLYSEAVSAMEAAGESMLAKRLEESAAAVGAMRKKAQELFFKAVSLIVEELEGEYGHR